MKKAPFAYIYDFIDFGPRSLFIIHFIPPLNYTQRPAGALLIDLEIYLLEILRSFIILGRFFINLPMRKFTWCRQRARFHEMETGLIDKEITGIWVELEEKYFLLSRNCIYLISAKPVPGAC